MGRDERAALVLAIAAHGALVAWLALGPMRHAVITSPERMTVSLAQDVAPVSTAPQPAPAAAAAVAPELGEAAPAPEPAPPPPPQPVPAPQPQPAPPKPTPPKPVPVVHAPAPAPVRPAPHPTPSPAVKEAARPAPAKPTPAAPAKAAPASKPTPKSGTPAGAAAKPTAKPGAPRLGADFLKGIGGDQTTAQGAPAQAAGNVNAAGLAQVIARQLKPKWVAPQGVDADKLVTVLAFDLNRDGSLAGRPRVVLQSGVTPANEAQKARHAELAIRAVELAAPFGLPPQYYDKWKHVTAFRFDRRLGQ